MFRLAMIVVVAAGCGGGGAKKETKQPDPTNVTAGDPAKPAEPPKEATGGPVGPVIDLRSKITKADVRARAPADDKATKQEFAVDVHGVKTKVVWRTFEDGGTKYILSIVWEVVTPVPGVTLESLGTLNTENAGTEAAPVQAEIVRARWHTTSATGTSMGEISVKIDATGRGMVI